MGKSVQVGKSRGPRTRAKSNGVGVSKSNTLTLLYDMGEDYMASKSASVTGCEGILR